MEGFLLCQQKGFLSSSWVKRWFVIKGHNLVSYSDQAKESSTRKLLLQITKDWSFTFPGQGSDTGHPDYQYMICITNLISKHEIFLATSSNSALKQWESALNQILFKPTVSLTLNKLTVIVKICSKEDPFLFQTNDPIFKILLLRNNYIFSEECHYYPDLRTIYERIKRNFPDISSQFHSSFPRSPSRNFLGVRTPFPKEETVSVGSGNELSDRRIKLEVWLQELLERFPLFSSSFSSSTSPSVEMTAKMNQRIASLYGCMTTELLRIIQQPDLVKSLGEKYGSQFTSPSNLLLPSYPKQLKRWSVTQLAKACRVRNIDCKSFHGRRQYVKALSPFCIPYLQGKDARKIVNQLKISGQASDVDLIFGDTCRRLGISETQLPLLVHNYSTKEKIVTISRAISIWDEESNLTLEDREMIRALTSGSEVDSFLFLTLLYRISQSTVGSLWIERFCTEGGAHGLNITLSRLLEREPRTLLTSMSLRYVVKALRLMISSTDSKEKIIQTRGLIESIVQCLSWEHHRTLSLEVLETMTIIILYGGEKGLWKIHSGLRELAHTRDERVFEIFMRIFPIVDLEMQCGVMMFINSYLASCSEVTDRLSLRQELIRAEFHKLIKFPQSESPERLMKEPNHPKEIAMTSCWVNEIIPTPSGRLPPSFRENHFKGAEEFVQSFASILSPAMQSSVSTSTKMILGPSSTPRRNLKILHQRHLECIRYDGETIAHKDIFDLVDLKTIVEYTTLPVGDDFSLHRNSVTLQFHDGRSLHLSFDDENQKAQCISSLTEIKDQFELEKSVCLFGLEENMSPNSATSLLMKSTYESLVSMYHSLLNEDLILFHSTHLPNFLSNSNSILPSLQHDSISQFVTQEFEYRKQEEKFLVPLRELVQYVIENFQPPVHQSTEKTLLSPPAVMDSVREIPRPPPLPYPNHKPKQKRNLVVQPFFWEMIRPDSVYGTIWMTMEEIELDWDMIDEQFAVQKSTLSKRITSSDSRQVGTSQRRQQQQQSLFEPKRIQNVEIAKSKLRRSADEIYDLIVNLDPVELTHDVKEIIINLLLPTAEELDVIRAYRGVVEDLDYCGTLFSKFLTIDRLETRLRLHGIMMNYSEELTLVSTSVRIIQDAVNELRDPIASTSFHQLLSLILSIGNYMNGSTKKGQAHGYRLDTLLKLKTKFQIGFKGRGRRHLLHFVIEQVSLRDPNEPPFYDRWQLMWSAGKISYRNIMKQCEELEQLFRFCEKEYQITKQLEMNMIKTKHEERAKMRGEENERENHDEIEDDNLKSITVLLQRLGLELSLLFIPLTVILRDLSLQFLRAS
jgi:hypothetical protein